MCKKKSAVDAEQSNQNSLAFQNNNVPAGVAKKSNLNSIEFHLENVHDAPSRKIFFFFFFFW